MTYTCTCGDTYTETIAKIEKHSYNAVETAPTCTKQGYTTYTCECGDSYIADYVDATGHSYTATVTAPTCTTKGYTTYICQCGDSYVSNYVDMLAHSYSTIVIDPTCTQNGHTVYTCVCGYNYTKTISAKDHNFNGSTCRDCGYDKAGDCTCNCHKSGIMGIIWKIINFFNKLLRKNQLCNCGVAHY